jgi:phenylacetate-CoA ligase
VPYYRRLFAERGFDPNALTSLAGLQKLPMLDKETIRANSGAMKREGARGLTRSNTGGSSGEPLVFYLGKERVSHDVAAKWRATRWWGVDIGDPEIVLWGSPIELGAQDRLRQLRDRMLRTELLPAFDMSAANMDRFLDGIRARRPRMLFGYPSSLALLAGHARQRGVALDSLGIRVAFVTSECLYPHQREAIEEAFGCPVANGYGGRDAGFIAHACPDGSLHLTAEDIVVEVVGRDGETLAPGDEGEIVVTHLRTADFPFVRYRTGDIGVLGHRGCSCGRTLPVLERIEGRSTDFVVAEDGTVLHGLALIYVIRGMPEVCEFRIVQESLCRTLVQIVAAQGYGRAQEESIKLGFQARLGPGVDIQVERVDEIPRERSGKFRYVVSRVMAP